MAYVPFSTLDDDALRALQANTDSGSQMRAISLELATRAFKAGFDIDEESKKALLEVPSGASRWLVTKLFKRAVWEALQGNARDLYVTCDPAPKGKVEACREARRALLEEALGSMHKTRVQPRVKKLCAAGKGAASFHIAFSPE